MRLKSIAIGWLLLATSFPISLFAQPDLNDQKVFRPTRNIVSVQINNPKRHALEVWYDGGAEYQKVKSSDAEKIALKLEEGKYFMKDTVTETIYPIPAIHFATGDEPLEVNVSELHQIEPETQMALIPSGPCLIGDEIGVGASDEPLSIKDVKAFWIAQYEVSNEQYVEFLNSRKLCDTKWLDIDSRKCRIQKVGDGRFSSDVGKQPVVMVSHAGAVAYCDWLSGKTGQKYRLPTEIEWEKAARGPYSSVYSYGNHYSEGRANQESGIVSDIGRFGVSDWGVCDMTGNVFEWMSNKYDPAKPEMVMNQALRGGSYILDGMYLRNSFRMRQSPTVMTDDIGFRVARDFVAPDAK